VVFQHLQKELNSLPFLDANNKDVTTYSHRRPSQCRHLIITWSHSATRSVTCNSVSVIHNIVIVLLDLKSYLYASWNTICGNRYQSVCGINSSLSSTTNCQRQCQNEFI